MDQGEKRRWWSLTRRPAQKQEIKYASSTSTERIEPAPNRDAHGNEQIEIMETNPQAHRPLLRDRKANEDQKLANAAPAIASSSSGNASTADKAETNTRQRIPLSGHQTRSNNTDLPVHPVPLIPPCHGAPQAQLAAAQAAGIIPEHGTATPSRLNGAAGENGAIDALENENEDEERDQPSCLICCDPIKLVSFGKCGHHAACGRCCIRMRMCYGFIDCPLCKAKLPEVVIAPWRKDIPSFAFFQATPDAAARSRPGELGPGRILADRWDPERQELTSQLLRDLVGSTSLACGVCDPKGCHRFARVPQLESHLWEEHKRYACATCLRDTRNFSLETPLYESRAEVRAHMMSAHPICQFCFGPAFTDREELISHLRFHHFQCYLCETAPDDPNSWFKDAYGLREHLANEHITCDDVLCAGNLVAFRTADELKEHQMEYHRVALRAGGGGIGTGGRGDGRKWPVELLVAIFFTSIAFVLSRLYPITQAELLT